MSINKFNITDWIDSKEPENQTKPIESSMDGNDIEIITRRIEAAKLDIAPNYADWRDLGFALESELGENGRSFYHRLSCFFQNYSVEETDKQYDKCLKSHGSGVTIKTLFSLAQKAGIDINTSSLSSSISSISSLENIEETKDIMPEIPLPTIAESLSANNQSELLPDLIKMIVSKANSNEDFDLLLLGSLTVFSAVLSNIHGVYGQREMFANLFLFVAAPASAGKGRLSLCRNLVVPIHSALRASAEIERNDYKAKLAEYQASRGKSGTKPDEPHQRTLFIPANSSSTAVFQTLSDNHGEGLMFETEGDTLALTFKSEYGNYSDGFRKAFHHETISYNRRQNQEFVELNKPKLSVVLSGTPRQIQALIPDAENGLFSRFMFYYMNIKLEWLDVFAGSTEEPLDGYFRTLGDQFKIFHDTLINTEEIIFSFTTSQKSRFNKSFSQMHMELSSNLGMDFVPSIRRLGLVTFRIAMIISAVRQMSISPIPRNLICADDDFEISMTISKILFEHTAKVFKLLQTQVTKGPSGSDNSRQVFYNSLPSEFDRKSYISIANSLNITAKTAERYIKEFTQNDIINHIAHGKYAKRHHSTSTH